MFLTRAKAPCTYIGGKKGPSFVKTIASPFIQLGSSLNKLFIRHILSAADVADAKLTEAALQPLTCHSHRNYLRTNPSQVLVALLWEGGLRPALPLRRSQPRDQFEFAMINHFD
ncbi:MAG: hypothetical protein B7X90_11170 [Novosphingobium sp. 17-62-19]|uniref:hypothetical protein n=1 Tax=Novosphingobium sp. 17-62-19 TaxID=1970406 RepID=UPI000BDDCF7E|nr:hypothetical protein [Novosphingobium sp. 17-62-19]OZA18729.1 MAG: hypothetical protein B7X90_11170 [Novosphingobium sp. 17-62-19]HQS97326.1 hypothetical protein [Novosphingobium sp.]